MGRATRGASLEAEAAFPAARLRWPARLDDRATLARVLIAPAVLFIAVLVGGPLVLSLFLSLTDATAGSLSGNFIGGDNFSRALESTIFRHTVFNTFLFTLASQVAVVVAATALAHVLLRNFRGKWLLRFLILLPWAAPISLGTIGWKWIFDSLYSVLNWTLRFVHILRPEDFPVWLGDPNLAQVSIISVQAWRLIPFATVIMIAGLSKIPQEIEDAALVDGAHGWRRMVYITTPLLLPIATIAVLFGVVFTAADMTVVYVLTGGGPFNSTHVLPSWAFQIGIVSGSLGSGAAIAIYLFPLLVLVTIAGLTFARRLEVT